jgi:cyclic pyranopterin phosphate synthase
MSAPEVDGDSAPETTGGLTHIDGRGHARMVDVTAKPPTKRVAVARCTVEVDGGTSRAIATGAGDALDLIEAARLAGIYAAKRTATLIPLCHPIPLHGLDIQVIVEPDRFVVEATAEVVANTGVEMEALTACAVAALTLAKASGPARAQTSVESLTLWHKSGGRSGDWERSGPDGRMAHRAPSPAPASTPGPGPIPDSAPGSPT